MLYFFFDTQVITSFGWQNLWCDCEWNAESCVAEEKTTTIEHNPFAKIRLWYTFSPPQVFFHVLVLVVFDWRFCFSKKQLFQPIEESAGMRVSSATMMEIFSCLWSSIKFRRRFLEIRLSRNFTSIPRNCRDWLSLMSVVCWTMSLLVVACYLLTESSRVIKNYLKIEWTISIAEIIL